MVRVVYVHVWGSNDKREITWCGLYTCTCGGPMTNMGSHGAGCIRARVGVQ